MKKCHCCGYPNPQKLTTCFQCETILIETVVEPSVNKSVDLPKQPQQKRQWSPCPRCGSTRVIETAVSNVVDANTKSTTGTLGCGCQTIITSIICGIFTGLIWPPLVIIVPVVFFVLLTVVQIKRFASIFSGNCFVCQDCNNVWK